MTLGTVRHYRLTDTERDERGQEHSIDLGSAWEVRCNSHGETQDCDSQRQADSLARNSCSFCQACADLLRASIVLDSEHSKELRDDQRAFEREREHDRTGRTYG